MTRFYVLVWFARARVRLQADEASTLQLIIEPSHSLWVLQKVRFQHFNYNTKVYTDWTMVSVWQQLPLDRRLPDARTTRYHHGHLCIMQ